MNSKCNEKINCTVTQCENNASDGCHCSLESINVSTHEANPTVCQCTDCMSFKLK